jgi:hypothetical protein
LATEESLLEPETGPERKGSELRILQAEHSEYLYKRENEIQDKIEQEVQLTPEERDLFWMRKIQHLQNALERIAQYTERY